MMLKVGRHIRPNKRFKLIVAREEGEVKFMEGYRNQYSNLYPTSCNGPLALIDGKPNQEDLKTAARVIARYSQGRSESSVNVEVRLESGVQQQFSVEPLSEIPQEWFV
jgi:predicted ribosome quality control (RQC) complex YloA/Tae2 family protein